jgi:hypothetical protein
LNIPVGDVKVDPIIDTVISPDYSIPASYVRHTKKIGDEEDPTIDYCLEDDDRVRESSKSLRHISLMTRNGLPTIQSLALRTLY